MSRGLTRRRPMSTRLIRPASTPGWPSLPPRRESSSLLSRPVAALPRRRQSRHLRPQCRQSRHLRPSNPTSPVLLRQTQRRQRVRRRTSDRRLDSGRCRARPVIWFHPTLRSSGMSTRCGPTCRVAPRLVRLRRRPIAETPTQRAAGSRCGGGPRRNRPRRPGQRSRGRQPGRRRRGHQ